MSDIPAPTAHLSLANRFVEFANQILQEGVDPEAVGVAMTHAAANFTAFAANVEGGTAQELDNVADEFRRLLHTYHGRHGGA